MNTLHEFRLNIRERLNRWYVEATGYALLTMLWTIATPFMASRVQHQVSPSVLEHWLVSWTVGNWVSIYVVMIVMVFSLIELLNWNTMQKRSYDYGDHVDEIVRRLAEKAGLKRVPEVMYVSSKALINAGAGSSYLYGQRIILFGDILKLSYEELEAVIAHEVAHLRMGDVPLAHFLSSLLVALRTVNFLIFIALVLSIFVEDHDVLWILAVTYIVTLFGSKMARLAQLKVSRICEYRADTLAIHWTSDRHREHLINALKKVRELSLLVALRKHEINEVDTGTHPTLRNRARSLGIMMMVGRLV